MMCHLCFYESFCFFLIWLYTLRIQLVLIFDSGCCRCSIFVLVAVSFCPCVWAVTFLGIYQCCYYYARNKYTAVGRCQAKHMSAQSPILLDLVLPRCFVYGRSCLPSHAPTALLALDTHSHIHKRTRRRRTWYSLFCCHKKKKRIDIDDATLCDFVHRSQIYIL